MQIATDRDFGSTIRRRVVLTITAALALTYIGRLIQLQVIEGSEYRTKSEAQGIKRITREPIRGAIYDRNGHVIVANVPSYSVAVTPNKITPETKMVLAKILGTDTATINEKIKQYKINDFSPARIWRDIDARLVAKLNEFHTELPGVDLLEESKRAYAGDVRASHLLGYTKEISREQLEQLGDYYVPGDDVGQSGIEDRWEPILRGEKGYNLVLVNNRGQRVRAFEDGRFDSSAHNGFDLYLGLDAGLQQYAEQLLQGYHGAVVAIDPNNGEILAMASAPDYDPNIFSGVTNRKAFNEVYTDPAKPLLNRASQAVYPSGSTWKMLMAIAGLKEGLITPTSTISCGGSFTLGNNTWKCHGAHGAVNARKAIHVSCNVFFYKLALQLGIDNYHKYGSLFHFGQKIAPDVVENSTRLPSRAYYDKAYGKDKWPKGVMVNLGIGQGELGVNPLQLAAYCAALANGGTWYPPHVVRAVKNKRLNEIEHEEHKGEHLGISKEIMEIIQLGMFDVVNTPGGTARAAKLDSILVAGKTGTAQAGKGKKDHAWFVCYAPFDKPKIAMCVLVENSGFGGTYSAPIARKLTRFFFTRQKEAGDEKLDETPRAPGSLPNVYKPLEPDDVQESDMIPEVFQASYVAPPRVVATEPKRVVR
jgi:penicillin-binding protein 2